MKVHIVIGGVDGEEVEVFGSLSMAQRHCGELNTERRRSALQAIYNHRVITRELRPSKTRHERRASREKFTCLCGEKRRNEFRESEPMRCKACRRAYNARRKLDLSQGEST